MILFLLACSTSDPEPSVTWAREVGPILASRCAGCHETGLAPFRLSTWEEVEPMAEVIVAAVESGKMPPWPFDPSCRPVPGSLALPAEEREVLLAWREAGYPRGEGEPDQQPAAAAEPVRPADEIVGVPIPFQVDPAQTDPYWCGFVSAPFPEEAWLEGAQLQVDDPTISHHAFLYAVPADAVAAIEAMDSADPQPGFRCDGGLAMDGGVSMLSGWAPGTPPWWPASEGALGMRIPAGSRFVLEMHYNTLAMDAPSEDSPAWSVWYSPSRPAMQLLTLPIADPSLAIPAQSEGWTESATTRLPVDALLVGTGPHMHGLGRSLSTTLERADGSEVCLTRLEGWDFHWQFSYPTVPEGIPVGLTDRIRLQCTYDNPGPAEVGWGERTQDEMCLDFLSFVVPSEPQGTSGTCGDFAPCFDRCPADDPFCPLVCMAHSGEACLMCGYEALYGPCTLQECLTEVLALDVCSQDCPDLESDYADCTYTACAPEWTAYESCWRAKFVDGTCTSDATCEGLAP
jgi:hypothetical protein